MPTRKRKNPTLALALAILFPGAGHLYLGSVAWFFAWLGVQLGLALLLIAGVAIGGAELGLVTSMAVFILAPIVFLAQLFHCNQQLRALSRERRQRRREVRRSRRAHIQGEIAALQRHVRELEAESRSSEVQVGDSFAVEDEGRRAKGRDRLKA